MIYVDCAGEQGELAVGEIPCGVGFACVTLTYEDIANPHFLAWFIANIHCRFISGSPPH
jgi:hypothetical protein